MILAAALNGKILPAGQAVLPVNDLGLMRGYGIFDYCRAIGSKPFLLERHLARFRRSAERMELELAYSNEQLTKTVHQLLAIGKLSHAGIRLLLTGGTTPDSMTVITPNLLILIEQAAALPAGMPPGVRLLTDAYQRELPEVKTTNYLNALRLQKQVREKNAYDLLYHSNGLITELPRSNFFLVKGRTVITPASGMLRGITRQVILELATTQYRLEERDVRLTELHEADEAFLSGTNKRMIPVVQVDDQAIGSGKPGVVTADLYEQFMQFERTYNGQGTVSGFPQTAG